MGTRIHTADAANVVATILPADDEYVQNLFDGDPPTPHVLFLTDHGCDEQLAITGSDDALNQLVRRVYWQAANNLRKHISEPVRILAAEIGHTAVAQVTDDEYRLLLSDQLLAALDARGIDVTERVKETTPPEPKPTIIRPSMPVELGDLVPGVVVQRYTDQDNVSVQTRLPCCRRPIEVPPDPDAEVDLVCPFDRLRYTVGLAQESDGGFLANFLVEGQVVVVKPHPRKRSRR